LKQPWGHTRVDKSVLYPRPGVKKQVRLCLTPRTNEFLKLGILVGGVSDAERQITATFGVRDVSHTQPHPIPQNEWFNRPGAWPTWFWRL